MPFLIGSLIGAAGVMFLSSGSQDGGVLDDTADVLRLLIVGGVLMVALPRLLK